MEKARFKWVLRERNRKIAAKTEAFTEQQARRVRSFHSSFKEYSPTPLIELTSLAQHLGIKNLFVKDESYRFELNAFKVLGGSFAIGSYIANELGEDYADDWMDKLLKASRGEEVYPQKKTDSKFVVGAPSGFSMIRVNFKAPLSEDRVQEIAEYHNVIIEFEEDHLIAVYGDKENLKKSLQELSTFFKEQLKEME